MQRVVRTLVLLAVPLLGVAAVTAEQPAEGGTKLTGEYVWELGGTSGDLEAVFTPAGEDGHWDVTFRFEHRGQPHTYQGSAKGSLGEGTLEGTVFNENKKREFTFRGSFADGKFSGTHAESGKRLGTLTLGS